MADVISTRIHGLDDLSGKDFENLCTKLLIKRGYRRVERTPLSGDYGVDIIAESFTLKFAIQCKRSNSKIGNKAVQEVFSGKAYYKCDAAVVVTNSYFTKQAITTAEAIGVVLWDRPTLLRMMIESGMQIRKRK